MALDNKFDSGNKNRVYGPGEQKLIDLNIDLKEEHDLSDIYPEVVKRLLQHAEKITMELGDPDNKGEKIRPSGYVGNPKPLLPE